jgi:hypothetical protein
VTATWTALDGSRHDVAAEAAYDAARLYMALFAPRTDLWGVHNGKHWQPACAPGCPSPRHRGENATDPPHAHAPMTPAVILAGRQHPVSTYFVTPEGTTHVLAIDFDVPDGLVLADRVARAFGKAGQAAFFEPSRRGAHLWATLTRPVPAIVAIRALRAFLVAAGIPEPIDPKIELRPSGDRGLGHALRMPLMPHQDPIVAYERTMMAARGRVVARSMVELVQALAPDSTAVDADVVLEWAARYRPPIDPRAVDPRDRPPRFGMPPDDGATVTAILAEIGVFARPGKAIRCPFHDDHNPSLSIAGDDRRAWCKQPACEAHGHGGRGLGTNQLRKLIRERRVAA